jgi:hypothetical protein
MSRARAWLRRIALGAAVVLGLALAGLSVWASMHWIALRDIPNLPSAYEAKEMCSCLFVEGRDEGSCALFVRQTVLPSDRRVIDRAAKTVTAEALWTETRARYVSQRHGCVLDRAPE